MHIHLLFSSQWLTNRRVRDVERDAEHPIDWALVLTAVLEHCIYPSHQNEKGNDQRNDKPQEHRLSRRPQIAPTPKTVWLKAHVGIVTEPLRHSVNEHCQKTKRHDLGGERYKIKGGSYFKIYVLVDVHSKHYKYFTLLLLSSFFYWNAWLSRAVNPMQSLMIRLSVCVHVPPISFFFK